MHDDSTVSIIYLNKVFGKRLFFLVGEFLNFGRFHGGDSSPKDAVASSAE